MKDSKIFRAVEEGRGFSSGCTEFSQEEVVAGRSAPRSSWSDLRKQFLQKRYLCLWVLAALMPFVLLRVLVFYDTNFTIEVPANAPVGLVDPDFQEKFPRGDQIRPDEDAWITHDDFIRGAGEGSHIKRRRNPWFPRASITHKRARDLDPPGPRWGRIFDQPEDNVKDWQEERRAENETAKTASKEEKSSSEERPEVGKETGKAKESTGVEEKPEERSSMEAKPQLREVELDQSKSEEIDKGSTENATSSPTQEPTSTGECNLFDGSWVHDPEDPLYTNDTCSWIQGHQNCMSNGRPDKEFLHWKWKPRGCDLPRFDAQGFLESFKGKTIGFVGDSLARNQVQSLVCMLSQVEKAVAVYADKDNLNVRWLFRQYNVTLAVQWSPYLLKESTDGILGYPKGQSVLYLDVLDPSWTSALQDYHIVVLSIGQWFYKWSVYVKGGKVIGHHGGGLNLTEVSFYDAYKDAVQLVLKTVAAKHEGIAIMSTFAVDHFEGGSWDRGGECRRQKPLREDEAAAFPGFHHKMRAIVLSEFERAAKIGSSGVHMELLDVTKISLVRADAHPGPYRVRNPYAGTNSTQWVPNDCLHWCLPGPVDTWNQLLVRLAHKHL